MSLSRAEFHTCGDRLQLARVFRVPSNFFPVEPVSTLSLSGSLGSGDLFTVLEVFVLFRRAAEERTTDSGLDLSKPAFTVEAKISDTRKVGFFFGIALTFSLARQCWPYFLS